MVRQQVVILTGHTGSGKTTLSNYLKSENWKIISAGQIFTKLALSHHVKNNRLNIQKFALKYFKRNGYNEFSSLLLSKIFTNDKKIIFEGIRPLEVIKNIKEKYPESILIFIRADESIRYNRLMKRSSFSKLQIQSLQNHPIEEELRLVEQLSDYTIDNNSTIDDLLLKFHRIVS
jgi:dephospho-CoA kinase